VTPYMGDKTIACPVPTHDNTTHKVMGCTS